ncbi:MAG TPA: CDP-alcohol phosphatidyltransferase family protein, partial [Nocardioides sp.]
MHQVQRRPLLHRLAHRRLGPADRVTLVRAVLSTVVAVLALVSLGRHVDPWLVIAVAGVALVLDRVDGEVARRTVTASDFGARFDMETDAYLIAALSVYVAPDVGWWVLLIGAARYLFLLAQSLLPRLRRPAPPRRWCKVVAVVQGVTLAAAASPVLPLWADTALLAVALALLAESFVHEGRDRWRHGTRPAPGSRPVATAGAGLLLWLCLMVPDHPDELTWSHWVGVPLEVLVLAALALVLPARAALALGGVAGGAVALLTVHAVLDLGFRSALDKPFDPLYDHVYAERTVELVEDMVGRWPGRVALTLAAATALLLLLGLPPALRRLTTAIRARRRTALPVVAGLLTLWLAAAAAGSGLAAREASRHAVDTVAQVRSDIAGERHFALAVANGAAVGVTHGGPPSFAPLRGRDVLLVFVESYGR